jgi:hypothetical protein
MRASDTLIAAIGPVDHLTYTVGEVIRLKSAEGKLAPYVDTTYIRNARTEVHRLNEAFRSASITIADLRIDWGGLAVRIDGQVVHPARVEGYRVFNPTFESCGRLFGPFWQNLPKTRRLQLTIDGEPVDEPDFSQLHPRLLYSLFGRQPDGDAYTIAGYEEHRAFVKVAWQIMINASARRAAVAALANDLAGSSLKGEAGRLLTALEKHHRSIATAFYTGAGLRLQWLDSELLMRIEHRCLREGIIALPVHDSLLVQQGRRSQRAQEIMDDELSRLLRSNS